MIPSPTLLARSAAAIAVLLFTGACGPAAPTPRSAPTPTPDGSDPALPPIPRVTGPLEVRVAYPSEGATLGTRDSTFIFGSVGTGEATLTINGAPVEVAPNGAFLGFLPVPADGVYQLTARAGGETATLTRRVELPATGGATESGLRVVPGSLTPATSIVEMEGSPVEVRLRASSGATARLILPGGASYPLVERVAHDRTEGFMLQRRERAGGVAEYAGTFPARALRGGAGGAFVELVSGTDTVRVPLESDVSVLPRHAPRVGVAASPRADGTLIGTAMPGGGTPYHWFFPNGAVLTITGTYGGQHRVSLTDELDVWVDTAHVDLAPAGTPPPVGTVGTVRAVTAPGHVDVRLSTSARLPFRVDPGERGLTVSVYGAETRTNWMQYADTHDELIERMDWEQRADDLYRLRIELSEPLWGYLAFYDEAGNLVVRVRRPPAIDPANPLRGLYVGVDAGHPPGGAIGPTGYTEAEANLAISKHLVAMLRERGARVLETRPTDAAVGLGERPIMATDSSVHVLVSVHNNAFADGVNPWENNGTSVFYNQAHSLDLARAFQRELLAEFRLRDIGISRADLALVRPTWMPSALTETMFLMIPRQEAALRDPAVQERIARAHLRALETFLRGRSAADP